MKNKKIRTEESLENFCTDLAEYNFILEQEYKKKVIPQQFKKNKKKKCVKNKFENIYRILRRGVYISFFFFFQNISSFFLKHNISFKNQFKISIIFLKPFFFSSI